MKKFFAVAGIIIFSLNCGGGSSSSGASDYILQPGSLTTSTDPTTIENFNVVFDSTTYNQPAAYAIIYRGTVNSVGYIGISADVDGDPTTALNIKLYFNSTSIPSPSISLTGGSGGFNAKVISGSGTYTTVANGDVLDLNFGDLQSDNTITITGGADKTIELTSPSSKTLVINSIKAYVYQ